MPEQYNLNLIKSWFNLYISIYTNNLHFTTSSFIQITLLIHHYNYNSTTVSLAIKPCICLISNIKKMTYNIQDQFISLYKIVVWDTECVYPPSIGISQRFLVMVALKMSLYPVTKEEIILCSLTAAKPQGCFL